MLKRIAALTLSLALAFPVAGFAAEGPPWRAALAADIEAGEPAELVIQRALAEALSLEAVLDALTEVVGVGYIQLFQSAASQAFAATIGSSVTMAVRANVADVIDGIANSSTEPGTVVGLNYAMKTSIYRDVTVVVGSDGSLSAIEVGDQSVIALRSLVRGTQETINGQPGALNNYGAGGQTDPAEVLRRVQSALNADPGNDDLRQLRDELGFTLCTIVASQECVPVI